MNEGLVERRLLAGYEDPEITEKKIAAMWALLEGKLDIVHPEHRPTIADFQGLPPGSKKADLFTWVKKTIDVDIAKISENENSPESIHQYKLLDYAYQQAKDFLRDTLKYEAKDINVKEPGNLTSVKDVLELLNNVVPLTPEESKKKGETPDQKKERLLKLIKYCRIIKVTAATYETFKNDAKLLKQVTEDFEKSMVSSPLEDDSINTPLILKGEDPVKGKKFHAAENYELTGTVDSRAKDIDKLILKFIVRAESNAKTALKDGIASRITIKKDQAIELLPILYEWLISKGAKDVEVSNQNYLSKNQLGKIPINIPLKTSKASPESKGKFETLKITGKLHSDTHGGQFEIQLVASGNKNEEGGMQHDIYDVVKLVSARTRLDGGCPANVFEEFVKNAHDESYPHLEIDYIKHELLNVDNAPIVAKRGKHGGVNYVTSATYERWKEFNWVDDSLFNDIEKAKK